MNPVSDQLSIDTPELIAIEMPLAGIGSRFIALLIDTSLWAIGMLVMLLIVWSIQPAIHAFSQLTYQWAAAITTFLVFLFNWGYFTLFEAFWNGRTPGKAIARIRVIQSSGRPIGIFESMARNFIRYIDQIPLIYAVGTIVIFCTRNHQRLGDLAAGTLVIRDRREDTAVLSESPTRTFTAPLFAHGSPLPEPHTRVLLPVVDVAKLSLADLEVLEGFLARRLDMPLAAREALAKRIAVAIQAKTGLVLAAGISVETFLEATARQLRDISHIQ